jgi:hypothetical protein
VAAVINLNRCNPDETRSKSRYLPAPARPVRIASAEPWLPAAEQLKVQTTRPVGLSGFGRGGLVLLLCASGFETESRDIVDHRPRRSAGQDEIHRLILETFSDCNITMKKWIWCFVSLGTASADRTVPNTVFYFGSLDLARTARPSSGRNPQRLVHKRWPTPFMDPDRIFLVRIRNIGGCHPLSSHIPVWLCTSRGRPISWASSSCGWLP